MSVETSEFFAKILLRCTVFGFLLLLFWFGMYMLAGDVIYGLHGSMFGLSEHELNVIHYCGMGLVKLVVICCFLVPWVSIRLVLRKAKD